MDLSDKFKGSYSVNLRILTKKSKLGFGYQDIKELIRIYFGLDKISFVDEILEEIGITEDMKIEKPGKIVDTDDREVLIKKAMENVKVQRIKDREAFKKMMEKELDLN